LRSFRRSGKGKCLSGGEGGSRSFSAQDRKAVSSKKKKENYRGGKVIISLGKGGRVESPRWQRTKRVL